jgi:hypothetical protein
LKPPRNIAKARREERTFLKLGTRQPVCTLCPESDPACLDIKNGHHVTGQQRDIELKVVVCANDQRKQHARLDDAGLTMQRESNPRELQRSRLLFSAEFLESLAEAHRKWHGEFPHPQHALMAKRFERLAKEYRQWAEEL